ncbi:glycosyltransferase [Rhizobium mulingense]|uniref:glycosyltransferase n=1 Tax=Rhizobium mulingense TaxID=3031128 RepID=UPI002B49EC6C|nr:glycosyltransferase [Rhizobium sp. MJ21]MEB3047733.1 glycosyltransferase [Rhizobium sp. MJ21]
MKKAVIYVEKFLPASQAFVLNQAVAFRSFEAEILAGTRISSAHTRKSTVPVHDIRRSPIARAGELLLKIPQIGLPFLFPAIGQADLVHAHFGKNGYVIGPLARAAGKPLVTTFHGFDATYRGDPKKPGGFNQVRFFAKGRSEMADWNSWNIAVSDFIRDRLLALGFRADRVYRHHIGIDLDLFKMEPRPRKKGLVVSIARFVDYKGHRFMIDALSRVAATGTPVEFVMVGQGPLKEEIEALARRSLPSVTIHENLSQTEIRDLLTSAELYLHGSVTLDNGHAEAFGLANLEAEAVGTPVVAFRSGGVGEAIEEGKTGYLVEERDVAGMAEAVGRLLNDQALWTAFSARAPLLVAERFDIRRQTGMLEDYYSSVLDEFSSRGRT